MDIRIGRISSFSLSAAPGIGLDTRVKLRIEIDTRGTKDSPSRNYASINAVVHGWLIRWANELKETVLTNFTPNADDDYVDFCMAINDIEIRWRILRESGLPVGFITILTTEHTPATRELVSGLQQAQKLSGR